MSRKFYVSDTHFYHENVIRYSRRPFRDAEEMNEEMIRRWCETVGPNDFVYHLGDFSFGKREKTEEIFRRLSGRKILVRGNHDPEWVTRLGWLSVHDLTETRDQGHKLVLCHYPMKVWNNSHHGAIQLHGHSHGSMPGTSLQCDVGVDCWDYTPVSLDRILQRLSTHEDHRHLDHHGKRTFELELREIREEATREHG